MDVITENSSSWKLCLLHSIYIFYTSRMFFRNLHFTILLDNPERISRLRPQDQNEYQLPFFILRL